MSLRINTNVEAFNAHRNLMMTNSALSSSLEKLSSGLRINHASDDAAGLSIADTLHSQILGLGQAQSNAQDGISMINTMDGALSETTNMLQRMRQLAVQSANGSLTTADRQATDSEFQSLKSEINNIASFTSFNTLTLLNGAGTFTFQVGANNAETFTVKTLDMTAAGAKLNLGVGTAGENTSTQTTAQTAITNIDKAIAAVSSERSTLGAASNTLTHTINNVANAQQNLSAAESQIRDTDMASEMTNMTRLQILMQSGTAMLSQANAAPQSVLSLLK
jgi:flagellin